MLGDDCRCLHPPFWFGDYESRDVGTDPELGRFGDVTVERCRSCGRLWLRYYWVLESRRASGRWYKGLITAEQSEAVTAETALKMLASLPWYFAGGSYFESTGHRCDHPLDLRFA